MNFYISKEVSELGIHVAGVVISDCDNTTPFFQWEEYKEKAIVELLTFYQNYDYQHDPILEGFYQLHEKVHVKRRKNLPAPENLIRLLLKHQYLFHVNPIVDCYNIISLRSKLALGAHDIDSINGDVTLRFTNGDEYFLPLGQKEPKKVASGEYSYIDDSNEIICRLEIRQVEKTKVTERSKNIFFIVQGNENTSIDYVKQTAEDLITLITNFFGGKGQIINLI